MGSADISNGILGIEFGSTRIKSVLIDDDGNTLATGSHQWENRLENDVWTYHKEDIWNGLQSSYKDLKKAVSDKYGVKIETLKAIGISAMMHGYIALDENKELLAPFRTWRNNITEKEAEILSEKFSFNIPQRWNATHLLQTVSKGEGHVKNLSYMTTLSGYIHYLLTGEKYLGVGDASGMFPIGEDGKDFDQAMLDSFDSIIADKNLPWKVRDILPIVKSAGESAGCLTAEGAKILDPDGDLKEGIPMCPPEGDAGTGMVATNSVTRRTGNVSVGTSIFSMIVLDKPMADYYKEIDIVTTPDGAPVAMVHCNNGSTDLDVWINLFKDVLDTFGAKPSTDELYSKLFNIALEGQPDGAGLMAYNYLSGETITNCAEGRPMFIRKPDAKMALPNVMRVLLYSFLATLKIGNDILIKKEKVSVDTLNGHGGFFKVKGVGQRMLAAALNTPVAVMDNAGEGGSWGMALLACFMANKGANESLSDFLSNKIFKDAAGDIIKPDASDVAGFDEFIKAYSSGVEVERLASKVL